MPIRKPALKKKPVKRAVWTIEKRALFLAELAMTSNVSASARAAKMKESQAYAERRKSSEFRADWKEALGEGYTRLEMMMLERAMRALSPAAPDAEPDPAQAKVDEYSNKLAMTLLSAHRASVREERGGAPPRAPVDGETARAQLSTTFDIIHQRMKARGDDGRFK